MATLRLWSWQLSPFAGKVRIALAEKEIEVELLEIDPLDRPPRLRELNPSNRVPVLEVDGVALRESSVICDWIEDVYPDPPLWPCDPTRRAAAKGLMRWVDDELTRNFFLSMRKQAFGLDRDDHPDAVALMRERLVRRWAVSEQLLARHDGPWLAPGEEPTLADLSAMPLAVRLPRWKPELAPDAERHPRTVAWLERVAARPTAEEVGRKGKPVSARQGPPD